MFARAAYPRPMSRDPLKTVSDVLEVAGAGLTLADRLAVLLHIDPARVAARRARRTQARIARLRGRAARLGRLAPSRSPRRREAMLARAAGATAEADALERVPSP